MTNTFTIDIETPQVTVDSVIFTFVHGALAVLLTERRHSPAKGKLALPGGFLWQNETSLQAATRILKDKTGVEFEYAEQLYTFDAIKRDPRGRIISISYLILLPNNSLVVENLTAKQSKLVPVAHLPKLPFDHAEIINYAVQRLRAKLAYTNVAYALLPDKFTLSDMQTLYEAIRGHTLDKRNFRKKILASELLKESGETQKGRNFRPAQLYQFRVTTPHELEMPIL